MNDIVSRAVDLVAQFYPDQRVMGLYREIADLLGKHPEHGPLISAYEADPAGNSGQAKQVLRADPAAPGRLGPLVNAAARAGGDIRIKAGTVETGDIRVDGNANTVSVGNKKKFVIGGALLAAAAAVVAVILLLHKSPDSNGTVGGVIGGPDPTNSVSATASLQPTATDPTSPPPTTAPTTPTTSAAPTPTPTPTSRFPSPPPAAFSAGYGGITGSSTCADYLQTSQDVQYESAEKIAIAENNGQAAGDPFIVENTEYTCGQNLNTELAYVMETIG